MILLLSFFACTDAESNTTTPAGVLGPKPASAAVPAPMMEGDGVVAQWNGGELRYSELGTHAEQSLKQLKILEGAIASRRDELEVPSTFWGRFSICIWFHW